MSVYIYKAEVTLDHQILLSHEMQLLLQQKNIIQMTFKPIVTNLLYLSTHPEVQQYLQTGSQHSKKSIHIDFALLSKTMVSYDQIRLLNNNGMEVVRVNYNDENPEIVSDEELQNKGKRYYFTDSITLEQNEIFVSPLDLNMENDEIEVPLKPMIRFGTPVFNENGNKLGIVLINYNAGEMLGHIRSAMSAENSSMLLNPEGYWMISPNTEDEWGFMYGNKKTFAVRYPEAWERISNRDAGSIITDDGLFTYVTIRPLGDSWISSTGASEADQRSAHEIRSDDYTWKSVLHIPTRVLLAPSKRLSSALIYFYIIGNLIIGVLTWRFVLVSHERKLVASKLTQSNQELKELEDIIKVSPGIAFLWRNEAGWPVEFVTENVKQFGYTPEELYSGTIPFSDLVHPDDLNRVAAEVAEYSLSDAKEFHQEYRLVTKDKRVAWVDDWTFIRRDAGGNITHYQGIMLDISDKKLAEDKLKQALDELKQALKDKDMLIKEVHHRVKNNLAVIQSLLSLQSSDVQDEKTKDVLQESQSRVRAMSMIHERLYQSSDISSINLPEYINSLATQLFDTYRTDASNVKLLVDIPNISLDVDTVIPCGLIINELLSNALKHAFPGSREGVISISIETQSNGNRTLMVKDNGIGIPESFDISKTRSLGMKIVNSLASQIGCGVEIINDNGSEFRIPIVPLDMDILQWSAGRYSVNLIEIDEQHKKLFSLLGELKDGIANKNEDDFFNELIPKLKDYVAYHFATEEQYMYKYDYPDLNEHIKGHKQFIAYIDTLSTEDNALKKDLTFNIFNFISEWIVNHIGITDKKLGKFISEQALSVAEIAHLKKYDVLIIEDDKLIQLAIKRFLDKLSYSYQVASNGLEALELIDKCEFNLIFTDLNMPAMDGYEFTNIVRELGFTKEIIAITGSDRHEVEDEIKASGMTDMICKPVSYAVFKTILEKYLR
ncbi:bacteriohemerythrin [Nitrospirota bacterium]